MSSVGTTPTGSAEPDAPSTVERGAQAVQEHGGAALDMAKDQAAEVARSAADHARTVFDSATDELRTQARTRASQLSGSLDQVSGELRSFADDSKGSTMLADVMRSLADASQRAARRLDDAGPDGVVQDVARYGRQHPGRFVAIAAASGFAAARLLRSADTSAIKGALSSGARPDGSENGHGERGAVGSFEPASPGTTSQLSGTTQPLAGAQPGTATATGTTPIELPPDAVAGLVEGGGPTTEVP